VCIDRVRETDSVFCRGASYATGMERADVCGISRRLAVRL
jgi:hypothetical protein